MMQGDLLAAIEDGDEHKCVGVLKGLNERARRALHPAVHRTLEAIDSTIRTDFGPSRSQNLHRHIAARLAMLGTATLGELKKALPANSRGTLRTPF